jgi:hypothetical protein
VIFSPASATRGAVHCAACPGRGTSPLLPRMFGPAFSGSEALGLDHAFACIESAMPPCSYRFVRVPVSSATGAIHSAASISAMALREKSEFPAALYSSVPAAPAIGDGHEDESLAPHGISGFGRAEYSSRNDVAQSLQCRDDGLELSVRVPRDVFTDDKIRPALVGDAADLGCEEAIALGSGALSGDTVVLAGVSRSEDMNCATPWSSVEGEHVRPDRSRMKPPCFHRRDQAGGSCGFPLHVTDASCSLSPGVQGEGDAEFEPSDAGAEGEDVPGT